MHDIDRSFMETEGETFEFLSGEGDHEGDHEGAYEGAYESEALEEGEVEQLASELLSLSSEQELDHFLGGLIKKVGGALGKVVSSPIGRQLGGMLKGLAKQALPMAGSALGNMLVPGLGGAIGGKLASTAGSMFGLEVEGLSHEDQQFEVAKQFVRLAGDAVKTAVAEPGKPAAAAVRDGMIGAAQKYAPGLLAGSPGTSGSYAGGHGHRRGHWVRRGNKIVLYGV